MATVKHEGFNYFHIMPENGSCRSDANCECNPLILKKRIPATVVVHFGDSQSRDLDEMAVEMLTRD